VRIAQVVSSYHPRMGGVEAHVRRLAQGCVEAGDRVTVLTHQVGNSPADEWVGGVRVLRFPLTIDSHNYPLSLSLFRHLRLHAADFDLVHAHNYHTIVGQAAISSRLPFVFTPHYHGTGHTPFAAFVHRLYRPAGGRQFTAADAVVCVSEAERDLVIKDFPNVAGKVVTIPNGTDPKQPAPDEDMATLDDPIVLTVGRLERHKNIDLIIDAFRALPSSATLVVVGDGPDRARLEHHAEAIGPGWPVLFTGIISDPMLDRLFAQANVVTSASDHEAFGMTLAEGLASGARVVASAIPTHAGLGRLAGVDAPVALVDPRDTRRFTDLLTASLLAGRIPKGSIKLPSWTEVVGEIRELYSRVLLQGRTPTADRRGPDMPQLLSLSDAAESAPTESA
jgi:glycosyltransferase involved in cell wall biosynthesis